MITFKDLRTYLNDTRNLAKDFVQKARPSNNIEFCVSKFARELAKQYVPESLINQIRYHQDKSKQAFEYLESLESIYSFQYYQYNNYYVLGENFILTKEDENALKQVQKGIEEHFFYLNYLKDDRLMKPYWQANWRLQKLFPNYAWSKKTKVSDQYIIPNDALDALTRDYFSLIRHGLNVNE